MRTLCRFGFDELRLAKIRLDVYEGNAAIRTYERVGFQREGILRGEIFRRGRRHDVIRMGLLANELAPGIPPRSPRRKRKR